MKNPNFAIWRRRIGIPCSGPGLLLFGVALLTYERYDAPVIEVHVQERLQYARELNMLWCASFYGSLALLIVSLFGLGWGRRIGIAANAGALLYSMMTLGAMCGPFAC
jgi:hypothetical protein